MIEKTFFGFVIECDDCSNYLNCDAENDFQEAIDMAKDKGWKIKKDEEGDWIHVRVLFTRDDWRKITGI